MNTPRHYYNPTPAQKIELQRHAAYLRSRRDAAYAASELARLFEKFGITAPVNPAEFVK